MVRTILIKNTDDYIVVGHGTEEYKLNKLHGNNHLILSNMGDSGLLGTQFIVEVDGVSVEVIDGHGSAPIDTFFN